MTTTMIDPAEVGFDAGRLARIDSHFCRYVDDGRLPGWEILVSRDRKIVHSSSYGHRDRDEGIAWGDDPIVRMYSISKPLTSVAAMILYEEGAFELNDPVSKFIASFADSRVFRSGHALAPVTEGLQQEMTIWNLLTPRPG